MCICPVDRTGDRSAGTDRMRLTDVGTPDHDRCRARRSASKIDRFVIRRAARAIGVLDAQDELAAVLFGEAVVDQRDVTGADVRVARRRGGDARSHRAQFRQRVPRLPHSRSTNATIWASGAPGVKISRTPRRFSSAASSGGIVPPPKNTMSPAPCACSCSTTSGKSVMWAPEWIERPMPSASS